MCKIVFQHNELCVCRFPLLSEMTQSMEHINDIYEATLTLKMTLTLLLLHLNIVWRKDDLDSACIQNYISLLSANHANDYSTIPNTIITIVCIEYCTSSFTPDPPRRVCFVHHLFHMGRSSCSKKFPTPAKNLVCTTIWECYSTLQQDN